MATFHQFRESSRTAGCYFEEASDTSADEKGEVQELEPKLSGAVHLREPENLLQQIRPRPETTQSRLAVFAGIKEIMQRVPGIADVGMGGSVAKGTDLEGTASDVDVVVMLHSLDSVRDEETHQRMLRSIEIEFQHQFSITRSSMFSCRKRKRDDMERGISLEELNSVQVKTTYLCGNYSGVAFDVLLAGPIPNAEPLLRASGPERSRLGASLSNQHVQYLSKTTESTKDAIRLTKWWALHSFKNVLGRLPRAFLLELLVLVVAETSKPARTSSPERSERYAFKLFFDCLNLIMRWRELVVTWTWARSDWQPFHKKRKPIIIDPCNPTNNVARTLNRRDWKRLQIVAEETLRNILKQGFVFSQHVRLAIQVSNKRRCISANEDDFEYLTILGMDPSSTGYRTGKGKRELNKYHLIDAFLTARLT